jgi:hypothetical protein
MSIFIFFVVVIIGLIVFAFVHKETPSQIESEKTSQPKITKTSQYKTTIGTFDSDAKIEELKYFCIKDKGYHVSVWPKVSNNWLPDIDFLEFNIAGMSYRDNIDNYLGECVGTLEPEPTNEYDPNAIKVLANDGHHVGYVPMDQTQHVRNFTTLPCPCYIYIGKNDGIYFSDCYINNKKP